MRTPSRQDSSPSKTPASPSGLYVWTGAEPYKNDILKTYQKKLAARGVTDTRDFVSQLILENGQLDPERLGDWECYNAKRGWLRGGHCSFGLPQINTWSSLGISAEEALRQHPEWKTLEWQLNTLADTAAGNLKTFGSVKLAVIAHNCPSCALARRDACWANGKRLTRCYYEKVTDRRALLTSL